MSILLFLLCISGSVTAQPTKPSGMLAISDSLYIDQAPVSNIAYLEFIQNVKYFWSPRRMDSVRKLSDFNKQDILGFYQKKPHPENLALYERLLPEEEKRIQQNLSAFDYLHHPDYANHPVLQINREQAALFCRWKTDMLQVLAPSYLGDLQKLFKASWHFRLPTSEELREIRKLFHEKDKLLVTKEAKPLKLKPGTYPENTLVFHSLSEISSDVDHNGPNWKGRKESIPNDATGFRCFCEWRE